MATRTETTRPVPAAIWKLSLGERIRWARKTAGLSHDRLIGRIGRGNRSHLIKIEKGLHVPRADLRDAIADATDVPRELFADPQEAASSGDPFRNGPGADVLDGDGAGRTTRLRESDGGLS